MTARFIFVGTSQHLSERFTMLMICGSISDLHYFSNFVGIGSSSQDEEDASEISLDISSSVANSNFSNEYDSSWVTRSVISAIAMDILS